MGRIITIRAEKDNEVIKRFGEYEKKIRREWNKFKTKQLTSRQREQRIMNTQNFLEQAFGVERSEK